MKIETAHIPAAGLDIEAQEEASIMQMEAEGHRFTKPIHLKLNVNLVGETLYVKGHLHTTATLCCDRCLEWFDRPIGNDKFVFEKKVKYHGEIIDLTENIREDIIVSLPLKTVCRQECRGLCPHCGRNLNTGQCGCKKGQIDTPFAALDKLMIGKKKKST